MYLIDRLRVNNSLIKLLVTLYLEW